MQDSPNIHFGYHERQTASAATEAFEHDPARAWGGARVGQKHGGAGRAGCNPIPRVTELAIKYLLVMKSKKKGKKEK